MNVARFFDHWAIAEDPFRAEEARQDPVFMRLEDPVGHPDLEKILGDVRSPATSIVFGEKGSGKTALRLQLERRIRRHNASHPDAPALLVPYDDLNPVLDRFHERNKADDYLTSLRKLQLIDHMDGILSAAVTRALDALLLEPHAEPIFGTKQQIRRAARSLPSAARDDLIALQAIYDAGDPSLERAARLRRILNPALDRARLAWFAALAAAWLLPLAAFALWWWAGRPNLRGAWGWSLLASLALPVALTVKGAVLDGWRLGLLARRILHHARTLPRSRERLAEHLERLPLRIRRSGRLPVSDGDDSRFDAFVRLRRALAQFGVAGVIVVIDRVDEPTLVSGDAERMRAVVWPMLNNKFLQMDGYGFKLLLPIELRHALFRESNQFFQEARLDKQNLIERLAWTGAALYDLCNARLAACMRPGAEPVALRDLFEPDVSRQDLIDALDQMRRPREAFKLIYRCIHEHCTAVTEDEPRWKVPRLVLDMVRKREAERLEQLNRGVRPA
ncbi:MAG: hypothetical protein IBJ10_04010 [Phycisphaerales bacterium]|nr:hypothetical protein [Phycisphaerales bacterium]